MQKGEQIICLGFHYLVFSEIHGGALCTKFYEAVFLLTSGLMKTVLLIMDFRQTTSSS